MNELTQKGIGAIKAGDKSTGRLLLRSALQQNDRDVQAWLWLSAVVETNQEKIECLQQVLRLDPDNQAAAKGIAQLIARGAASIQSSQVHLNPSTEIPHVVSAIPQKQPETYAVPAKDRSVPARDKDQEVFSVKPSLTPTLIRSGCVLIFIAPILFVFFGLLIDILVGFGESESSTLVYCLSIFLIFILLYPIIRRIAALLFTSYTLTHRHLVVESGILSKQHKTIPIQKIQDVAYSQTILERSFGIGDVIVESAGEWGSVHLMDLADCKSRTKQILAIIQSKE
jgi:membrane protein YdbS with pleckstrin-like domain